MNTKSCKIESHFNQMNYQYACLLSTVGMFSSEESSFSFGAFGKKGTQRQRQTNFPRCR